MTTSGMKLKHAGKPLGLIRILKCFQFPCGREKRQVPDIIPLRAGRKVRKLMKKSESLGYDFVGDSGRVVISIN